MFTVNDSKFNDLLITIYNSVGEQIVNRSDIVKRLMKGLQLDEVDVEVQDQDVEGSGEGMG
jgi:hypothetical protein